MHLSNSGCHSDAVMMILLLQPRKSAGPESHGLNRKSSGSAPRSLHMKPKLEIAENGDVTSVVAMGSSAYSGGLWELYPPLLQKLRFTLGRIRGRAVVCRVPACVDHTFIERTTSRSDCLSYGCSPALAFRHHGCQVTARSNLPAAAHANGRMLPRQRDGPVEVRGFEHDDSAQLLFRLDEWTVGDGHLAGASLQRRRGASALERVPTHKGAVLSRHVIVG